MMKFYEYREEIPKNKTRIGKERLTLLWSFVNSGYKIAKVDFQPEYKSANSAYATLKRVIEKKQYSNESANGKRQSVPCKV